MIHTKSATVRKNTPSAVVRMEDVVNSTSLITDIQNIKTDLSGMRTERLYSCGGCDVHRIFKTDNIYKSFIRIHAKTCPWANTWKSELLQIAPMNWPRGDRKQVHGMPKSIEAVMRVRIAEDEARRLFIEARRNEVADTTSVISELTSSVAEQTAFIQGRFDCDDVTFAVFKDIGEECFTETDPLTIFRSMYIENIKILEEFKETTDAKLEELNEKVALLSTPKVLLNVNLFLLIVCFYYLFI